MKKYFLSIVALAGMLFATSCQESLVEPQVGGTTTFTVQVPDAMGTKAIGDAENTNKLYVQVYPEDFSGNAPIYNGGATMGSDGMFRVSINLIQGHKYGIIFWAQNESSKYDVDDLRNIDLDIKHHNSELGAAFYHTMTFEAGESQKVVLKRPFAQLNLGTSAGSLDTDVSASNIELLTSKVIVTGIASSFNTVTGEGESSGTYTYETDYAAVNTDKLNVADVNYHYISMDYLPVVDNESLVTVQAYVRTNKGEIEHSFTNVPVKKNYRTNIVGNLISSTTDFEVSIDSAFDGTYEGNFDGLVVDGATQTITVLNKTGFLNLTRLFAEWTALFSNGQGTDITNFFVENGGKGADYYYGDRWTISLEADINLNNETISPVILKHPLQTGVPTFDGNNHTIKNAKIVTDANTENKAGLFDGSVNLKNLKLDNIHVTGSNKGNSSAGILSGSTNENVQNITITNSSVTGGKYTGGITGYGYTYVTNCSLTNVTVKGGYKLGGVIGYISAEIGTGDVISNTLIDCTVDGIGGGVFAGGKSEYIIGKVVGNYNCNGSCSNNMVANMTTKATSLIGKIEAGKNVTIENNVFGVSNAPQLKDAIIEGGKIELMNDITVDEWIMFSEDLNISDGTIITIDEINVTIDGKGHTLTVKAIESAGNNDQLFQGASNLNISNLTIKYADGLTTGGLGMVSGVIKNVHFVGGGASASSAAIFPRNGVIKVEDCIFDTNGVAFYFDHECDNLTVTGCTFNQNAEKNVILLRGDVKFKNNIINSGRTVNIVSGSPVVEGNNFNNVRLKVYEAATATVKENRINNLVFETDKYKSTFTNNTLSDAAQAALNSAVKVN